MSDHPVQTERPEAKDFLSKYPGPISWVVTIIIGVIFLGGLAATAGGGGDHDTDHATTGEHGDKADAHGDDKAAGGH